jgi:GTP cyclohydrolase-4
VPVPSLSRVGLTGLDAVLHVAVDRRAPQLFAARFACAAEPPARQVDSARFEDAMRDAVRAVVVEDAGLRIDRLAERLAERLRERLGARRAEVTIEARFPERRPAPVSGTPTQEISTLHGAAVASDRGTRRLTGVSAQGMTTSPYAQETLVARAHERLAATGFSTARIARILQEVPVATHSQLSVGTLHLGCPERRADEFAAADLLAIVQAAMASEIFELLKRSDEAAVVERAHRRPRFAGDCVRAMLGGVLQRFADAPDDVFVAAAQENVETIHGHDVVAERAGLLGDLRRERATGEAPERPASVADWLAAAS